MTGLKALVVGLIILIGTFAQLLIRSYRERDGGNPLWDEIQFWLPFRDLITYSVILFTAFALLWAGALLTGMRR